MKINQMESDLLDNASDRLRLWIKDTVMRCDIVDLGAKATSGIIVSCLVGELCNFYDHLEMEPVDAGRVMYDALKSYQEAKAKIEARQKRDVK